MRWLELEGAANARDVGGLPTDDGRQILDHRLLRSDNLQGLTPTDVKLLVEDLGVTSVVDLRSTDEVESEGPGPLVAVQSVRHVHLSVMPEYGQATDAVADALLTRRDRALARFPGDPMCAFYLGYLEDRPDSVVSALRSIGQTPGAALVHCAAGKDRTGVVVALALSAAGTRRDAVIADYAASGNRIGAILARLRASPTYAPDLAKRADDDHRPRAETMSAFLNEVDEQFGGVLPWLSEHGFGEADLAALRAKLLS
ncbi:MAG TPA: tyrosine-protein phosphatase [Amycolatopsis sp.]|uniref:tyrosine-protein phosphatase n=1 Tax=Amycolatopsis sp. TaxID=37632 RepID=UPI002B4A58C6|nr:tyrosine-protein phosphatase [Amycolatopsis sp.]HKS44455.1 tyrosine-protein phosphatase [Amycolatopsis sp.]